MEQSWAAAQSPPGGWGARTSLTATQVVAVIVEAGMRHTATDGMTASLVAPDTLASVVAAKGGTRVTVQPSGESSPSFTAMLYAVRTALTAADPRLDVAAQSPARAAPAPSPTVTLGQPASPAMPATGHNAGPIPYREPQAPSGPADAVWVVMAACSAAIAAICGLAVWALASDEPPEWMTKWLLPLVALAVSTDAARIEMIALGLLAGVTCVLALTRNAIAPILATLTGVGALATCAAGAIYTANQTSTDLVPYLVAPRDFYGFFVFAGLACVLGAFGVTASASTATRATVLAVSLAVLVAIAFASYTATSSGAFGASG